MNNPVQRCIPGIDTIRSYGVDLAKKDVLGGMALWAMLVPQSLGFAVLAGLAPVVGLYAALGSMFAYWLWGSSRFLRDP